MRMDQETTLPLSKEESAELPSIAPCASTGEVAMYPDRAQVGLIGSVVILVNVVVGRNLVGIPATLGYCGIIPGQLFVIGVVLLSYFATSATLTLQRATNSGGLDDTAEHILGWKGRVPLSIMILVFNVCGMFCRLVAATDVILSWLSHRISPVSLWPRSAIVFGYGVCAPIALSIPRSLAVLAYVSGLAIFCAVFFAGLMAIGLWQYGVTPDVNVWTAGGRSVESIGLYTVVFSMTLCVCPLLAGSHPDVTVRRRTVSTSMLMATLLTVVPSLCAYLVYGARCEEDILDNLTGSKWRHLGGQIVIFAIASCSYPLLHRPVCCSLASMVFRANQAVDLVGGRRVAIIVTANAVPLLMAMLVPTIRSTLSLVASVLGCVGSFSAPGLMWVVHSPEKKFSWRNILAMAMILIGIALAAMHVLPIVAQAHDS